MAHFAQLNSNNMVVKVEVVVNEIITDGDGVEQEQLGIDFLNSTYNTNNWYKQASYSGTFRKNYPSTGYFYDVVRDAFYTLQPYPSWILNETTCIWESPVAYPVITLNENGMPTKEYIWNEATTNWVEIT